MSIYVVCPNGHRLRVQVAAIGRRVTCTHCHQQFRVPADAAADGDDPRQQALPIAVMLSMPSEMVAALPRAVRFVPHAKAGREPKESRRTRGGDAAQKERRALPPGSGGLETPLAPPSSAPWPTPSQPQPAQSFSPQLWNMVEQPVGHGALTVGGNPADPSCVVGFGSEMPPSTPVAAHTNRRARRGRRVVFRSGGEVAAALTMLLLVAAVLVAAWKILDSRGVFKNLGKGRPAANGLP